MDEVKHLNSLRQDIDEIDLQLLALFEARMGIAQAIAKFKQVHQLQILDTTREGKVLAKTDQLQDLSLKKYALDFFKTLMDISKTLQADRMRQDIGEKQEVVGEIATQSSIRSCVESPIGSLVELRKQDLEELCEKRIECDQHNDRDYSDKDIKLGFQGLPGSYSEQALKQFFGEEVQGKNYSSFEDVFIALQDSEIDYGVLPLENSFTGGIAEVYDLLCHYGFHIIGEQSVQVDHNLLAVHGATLESIKDIYSHSQALLQCSQFLKDHPEYNPVSYSNTAVSAKLVADAEDLSQAAIASKRAATLYGLNVLVEGINNNKENFTRFIIIGRYPKPQRENNKISIAVAISHEAGSLYRILSYFAQHGLNMLKIESRPMAGRTWEYLFYIDFEGNLQKAEVQQAVEQIKEEGSYFKLLGNYPANPL